MTRRILSDDIDLAQKISLEEPAVRTPDGGLVYVRIARFEEIETLRNLAAVQIDEGVCPTKAMQDIYRHNPETVWTILRSPNEGKDLARMVGFYCFLHLNAAGLGALNARTLRPRHPDPALLAAAGERPAAVYIWAVVAPKLTRLTTPLIGKGLGVKRYGGLPFYATAGTLGGLNWLKNYGFDGASGDDSGLGDLFHFYMPGEADRASAA